MCDYINHLGVKCKKSPIGHKHRNHSEPVYFCREHQNKDIYNKKRWYY